MTGRLGPTGPFVGPIALGTVELGMSYGFAGDARRERPGETAARAIIETAIEAGVGLIDTAPAYGSAEQIVGRALGERPAAEVRPLVATKLRPFPAGPPLRGVALSDFVEASIDASRAALKMDRLDVLQVHNATPETVADGSLGDLLEGWQAAGVVGVIGATIYDRGDLAAIIADGRFTVVQAPISALDRRLVGQPLDAAAAAGIAVVARSVLLRGILSPRRRFGGPSLAPLVAAADALEAMAMEADLPGGLVELAYRDVLAVPGVTTMLVGASAPEEVTVAVEAASRGALDAALAEHVRGVTVADPALLDPRTWPADA